jgi:hypothetical protein
VVDIREVRLVKPINVHLQLTQRRSKFCSIRVLKLYVFTGKYEEGGLKLVDRIVNIFAD